MPFDIILLGDIIGKPGRRVVRSYLEGLSRKPDLVIANAENAAHGFGLTEKIVQELSGYGIQVLTGGNHTFDRKEIFDFIDKYDFVLRPANYPSGTKGRGTCIIEVGDFKVGIINVMGRVFMEPLDSPFLVASKLVEEMTERVDSIIVDVHAEATAEKITMGWYLDGKVAAVIGSHTHVQTADERILPGGTAYITDMGCCGPSNGVIGMDKTGVFRRMVEQLPSRFEVADGPAMANGVKLSVDLQNNRTLKIERVHYEEAQE